MENTVSIIAKINNQDLVILSENEGKFVPIKPVCNALGIAFESQYQKLKDDEDLSSVITLRVTTGADGKQYEMVCLPFEYVAGWLFTINPKNVAPEAKEAVRRYRMECYRVLCVHFMKKAQKQLQANADEIKMLERLNELTSHRNELSLQIKEIKNHIEQIRVQRMDQQLTLF